MSIEKIKVRVKGEEGSTQYTYKEMMALVIEGMKETIKRRRADKAKHKNNKNNLF